MGLGVLGKIGGSVAGVGKKVLHNKVAQTLGLPGSRPKPAAAPAAGPAIAGGPTVPQPPALDMAGRVFQAQLASKRARAKATGGGY